MNGKLNIPTPAPSKFNFQVFDTKPVPYQPTQVNTGGFPRPHAITFPTEKNVSFPAPYDAKFNPLSVNEGFLSTGISAAEKIISGYLANIPDGRIFNKEPKYTIPPPAPNNML